MNIKKSRLNIELTQEAVSQLQRVQENSGSTTLTEAIRRALALYDLVLEQQKIGGKIIFEHADGSREVLRLL